MSVPQEKGFPNAFALNATPQGIAHGNERAWSVGRVFPGFFRNRRGRPNTRDYSVSADYMDMGRSTVIITCLPI
jgi:hypothetical protein